MTAQNTNIFHLDEHATPQERASRWIARIDAGPLTPEERQELRDWLGSDPANARLLDTQALLWSHASRAAFPPKAATRPQAGRDRAGFGWPRMAGLAACSLALVAVLVGTTVRQSAPQAQLAAYSTPVGKTSDVRLDDGSTLHLNTASSTRVSYSGARRLIVLNEGEGYFEVAKDRSRPFDVLAGNTIVRAVGTKFSVRRLEADRIEVVVTEGVVELLQKGAGDQPEESRSGKLVRLAQGQSGLQIGRSLWITQREEKTLNERLAWVNGRLSFDDTTLAEAVAQVNRYSTEKIEIADPALRQLKISGSFNIGEVPVFLNSLERGFGLQVRHEDGVARISRPDS